MSRSFVIVCLLPFVINPFETEHGIPMHVHTDFGYFPAATWLPFYDSTGRRIASYQKRDCSITVTFASLKLFFSPDLLTLLHSQRQSASVIHPPPFSFKYAGELFFFDFGSCSFGAERGIVKSNANELSPSAVWSHPHSLASQHALSILPMSNGRCQSARVGKVYRCLICGHICRQSDSF